MDPKHQFVVELFQLARRWRVQLDERLRPAGLTKSSWAVLYWVSQSPEGVTQRDLAAQIGVETSTLTRQLDAMETQGWIERQSVHGDRRLKLVRLTDMAQRRLDEIAPVTRTLREELMGDIDETALRTAVEVMMQVHGRLR